jgi:hypothetical protein
MRASLLGIAHDHLCAKGSQVGFVNLAGKAFSPVRCHPQRIQRLWNRVHASGSDMEDETDWDAEMTIFTQRKLKPNQLEALRKLEEQNVDVGRVS